MQQFSERTLRRLYARNTAGFHVLAVVGRDRIVRGTWTRVAVDDDLPAANRIRFEPRPAQPASLSVGPRNSYYLARFDSLRSSVGTRTRTGRNGPGHSPPCDRSG